jgi:hypothetical protein
MAEVNIINWHVTPMRADRWYAIWRPAFERAAAFGATSYTLTRSEDDHLHFVQTTIWDNRADFERYWSSDEVAKAREDAINWFAKPLLPSWHVLLSSNR